MARPRGPWADATSFGNPYAYVGNNPGTLNDPSGMCPACWGVGAAFVVTAGAILVDTAVYGFEVANTDATWNHSVARERYKRDLEIGAEIALLFATESFNVGPARSARSIPAAGSSLDDATRSRGHQPPLRALTGSVDELVPETSARPTTVARGSTSPDLPGHQLRRETNSPGPSGTSPGIGRMPISEFGQAKASTGVSKRLAPNPLAEGPHVTFRTDKQTGLVTNYAEWVPNPFHPEGWDLVKRVDLRGEAHYNKVLGIDVPTPHVQARGIPGGVRPAYDWELPR